MALLINGSRLSIEDVVHVAREGERVELAPEAVDRIKACRAMLDKKIAAREIIEEKPYVYGRGVDTARKVIRRHVDFLDLNRPLYPDHNRMKALVGSGEILHEVEKEVGSLG